MPVDESISVSETSCFVRTCFVISCWRREGEVSRERDEDGLEGLRPKTLPDCKSVAVDDLDGLHIGSRI